MQMTMFISYRTPGKKLWQNDTAAPKKNAQKRHVDVRMPTTDGIELTEIELSEFEWKAYFS